MSNEGTSPPPGGWDSGSLLQSLTIPERITLLRARPELFTPDPARAESVGELWATKLGRDGAALMDDRFADLGIERSELPLVLGTIDPAATDSIPHEPWMDVCAEVAAWSGRGDVAGLPDADFLSRVDEADDADTDADEQPVSFEHALVPWVEIATRRLREAAPGLGDVLPGKLLRRQQRALLEGLSNLARFVFTTELGVRRAGRYRGNDLLFGLMMQTPPREVYEQTVRALLGLGDDAGQAWMPRYPALARLLGTRVVAWVRALVEFTTRLEADRALIASEFNAGEDPGALVELSFGSGDSHNGGRTVGICTFECGCKVVYKPRNGRIDVAFAGIVDWANAHLDEALRLRVPRTIDRGLWCWAEFIVGRACASPEELALYYRRMGTLLGILHALQGNDFHLENVIAHGPHPVPIDLETVCVPDSRVEDSDGEEDAATTLLNHSVLRTLLLPNVIGFRGRKLKSLGAVQVDLPGGPQRTRTIHLVNVNTDFQRWATLEGDGEDRRPESQAWVEDGEGISGDDQMAEIGLGYEATYRMLQSRRDELLGASSPLRDLSEAWVRVLNRATNVYFRLLHESCTPSAVASGVDRWISLERLGLIVPSDAEAVHRPVSVELVDAEAASLLEGDIAYLTAPGSSTTIWTIDPSTCEPVELPRTSMKTSAVDCAFQQVERMGDEDLALQKRFQGDSFRATMLSLESHFHGGDINAILPTDRSERPVRALLEEGLEGFSRLAIQSGSHLNWIDFSFDEQLESLRPASLDMTIYSGRGGLALLFERAYRVLGDRRWLEIARAAIGAELKQLESTESARQMGSWPLSGLLGRAGLVAGAWAVGRHEDHGRCREFARDLAVSVSDRVVRKDDVFDLIAGSAGYLLLLLRLHEEEPLPGIESLVDRLSRHLLDHAIEFDGIGWSPTSGKIPLCGLGHGRSGIALALLEAGRFLGRADLRARALEAFEAEHRLRGGGSEDGWPDYRGLEADQKARATFNMHRWCAGSEGIALARAAALQVADVPFLRDDLEFARSRIKDRADGRLHLCCGQSGRLMAHQTLRRLGLGDGLDATSAEPAHMAGMIQSALDSSGSVFGLGLFQGLGGVLWAGLSTLEPDASDLLLVRP